MFTNDGIEKPKREPYYFTRRESIAINMMHALIVHGRDAPELAALKALEYADALIQEFDNELTPDNVKEFTTSIEEMNKENCERIPDLNWERQDLTR